MRKYVLGFLLLAVVGCTTPQTPQQSVFQAKAGYATALTAAVAYKRLPLCPAPAPCSDKEVVGQLQRADLVAATALDAAEAVVRSKGFGQDTVASAVTAAQAALNAFVAITSTLKGN